MHRGHRNPDALLIILFAFCNQGVICYLKHFCNDIPLVVRAVSDSAKIFMYDYFYAGIPTPPSFAFGRRSGSIDSSWTNPYHKPPTWESTCSKLEVFGNSWLRVSPRPASFLLDFPCIFHGKRRRSSSLAERSLNTFKACRISELSFLYQFPCILLPKITVRARNYNCPRSRPYGW